MKIQEFFQGTFKLFSIAGQVLYLRRQTIEHPNPRLIPEYFINRDRAEIHHVNKKNAVFIQTLTTITD